MSLPDVVYFVDEPPEISFVGGLFHIKQRLGENLCIERVMLPNAYFLGLRRAAEAAKSFKFSGADILPFKLPGEDAVA